MAKKVKLIYNPIANLGRAGATTGELRSQTHENGKIDWVSTEYPGHAIGLAKTAAEEGYDTVIGMGGDGTAHEVLNGLMQIPEGKRPLMGVIPAGSGNDFSYACGMNSLASLALQQILKGSPMPVDVGLVRDDNGKEKFWGNTIGIGFDTIVTIRSRKVPIVKGFLIYFVAVLQTILLQYEEFHIDMKLDGKHLSNDLIMLVLCNGPREGGGFLVSPNSRNNDGVFDFFSVDRINRLMMLRTLPEVMSGTQAKLKHCRSGWFKHMTLQADKPLYIHMDGEVYCTPTDPVRQLEITMLPGAIQIVC
jgi:YegS/Rv2252/BmrU family lipid kinase